jgi:hypothetical protein
MVRIARSSPKHGIKWVLQVSRMGDQNALAVGGCLVRPDGRQPWKVVACPRVGCA